MKTISKIALGIAVSSALFMGGCNSMESSKPIAAKPSISEESLGLRKTNLLEEDKTVANKTQYSKEYAGSGYKIKRAFQDAPPMIPHDTEGLLPITIHNNQCVGCHMPEVASSMGATPIPKSHFTNFRPTHKYDGKIFKKSVDNLKNEVSIKSTGDKLSGSRFNCSQCHAPQSTGELAVENTFKAEYLDKDGDKKSHWEGTRLTSDLDTIGEDSKVTDADYKNKDSAAGHLNKKH